MDLTHNSMFPFPHFSRNRWRFAWRRLDPRDESYGLLLAAIRQSALYQLEGPHLALVGLLYQNRKARQFTDGTVQFRRIGKVNCLQYLLFHGSPYSGKLKR